MNLPGRVFSQAVAMCLGMAINIPSSAQSSEKPVLAEMTDAVQKTLSSINTEGKWDIYLSGYAHHSRESYSHRRLRRLNEQAWGIGFGKTTRNPSGNDESLYAMAIRDSNENLQWSAGYSHQWVFPLADTGLEVGAGLSALLISRKDWFDRVPFPAILPVFSIGTQHLKLTATYVPRISTRKGKGDVTLVVLKYAF